MKKKILIVSRIFSTDDIKKNLLDQLRLDGVKYEKNRHESIVTKDAIFFFFHLYGRNLQEFERRHKKVDCIYSNDRYIINQLKGQVTPREPYKTFKSFETLTAAEASFFLSLVEHDMNRIDFIEKSADLLLKEIPSYQVMDVFQVTNSDTIRKSTILTSRFNSMFHHRTEEEANTALKKKTVDRITYIEKQINTLESTLKSAKELLATL